MKDDGPDNTFRTAEASGECGEDGEGGEGSRYLWQQRAYCEIVKRSLKIGRRLNMDRAGKGTISEETQWGAAA